MAGAMIEAALCAAPSRARGHAWPTALASHPAPCGSPEAGHASSAGGGEGSQMSHGAQALGRAAEESRGVVFVPHIGSGATVLGHLSRAQTPDDASPRPSTPLLGLQCAST